MRLLASEPGNSCDEVLEQAEAINLEALHYFRLLKWHDHRSIGHETIHLIDILKGDYHVITLFCHQR